ncbi:MAG: nitronate monooxygenase, partial [Cyanobacteria bacterium J06659_2]
STENIIAAATMPRIGFNSRSTSALSRQKLVDLIPCFSRRLPDAIVIENPNSAGGHLGAKAQDLDSPHFEADQVIPELIAYLHDELQADMPLIAAGGIWDRGDIDRALALGARGVQIGTRFITT